MTGIRHVEKQWTLPTTWEWKSLADIATTKAGSVKAVTALTTNDGTVPLVLSGDLKNSKKIETDRRIHEADLAPKGIKLFTKGQLLLATIGSTAGAVGILDFDAALNKAIFAIAPNEKDIRLDFLFYYFRTRSTYSYIKSALTGSAQQHISIPDVRLMQIPVPISLEEQRRIVLRIEALIQDIQRSRILLEKMHSDVQQTLERELVDIFTSPATKKWANRAALRKLLKIKSNRQSIQHPIYQQYPFIDTQSIEPIMGRISNYLTLAEKKASEDQKKYVVENEPELILCAKSHPEQHRVAMLNLERAICNTSIYLLSITEKQLLHPRFLMWSLIAAPLEQFSRVAAGINMIAGNILLSYELQFPSMNEQRYIISRLDQIQQSTVQIRTLLFDNIQKTEKVEIEILEKAFRGEL